MDIHWFLALRCLPHTKAIYLPKRYCCLVLLEGRSLENLQEYLGYRFY